MEISGIGREYSTSIGRGWRYQVLVERTPQLLGEAGDIRNRQDSTSIGKDWRYQVLGNKDSTCINSETAYAVLQRTPQFTCTV
jgi:hypothetical protein